jgi:hypothetical protein
MADLAARQLSLILLSNGPVDLTDEEREVLARTLRARLA